MVVGFELDLLFSMRDITDRLMISIDSALISSFFLLLGPVIIMSQLLRGDVGRILVGLKGSSAVFT